MISKIHNWHFARYGDVGDAKIYMEKGDIKTTTSIKHLNKWQRRKRSTPYLIRIHKFAPAHLSSQRTKFHMNTYHPRLIFDHRIHFFQDNVVQECAGGIVHEVEGPKEQLGAWQIAMKLGTPVLHTVVNLQQLNRTQFREHSDREGCILDYPFQEAL